MFAAMTVWPTLGHAENLSKEVKKAVERSTLDQSGTKAFHLRATVAPSFERDKESGRTGEVEIWWASPTQWKREVRSPEFHQIEIVDGHMKVKRELEAGWFQRVEVPLPAVITIQSGINKPRYATLKGVIAAKKKDIAVVERTSLDVRGTVSQRIERIYIPEKAKQTEFITGNPDEIALRLMDKLKHGARIG